MSRFFRQILNVGFRLKFFAEPKYVGFAQL